MLFSSLTFLFLFLPITIILYYLVKNRTAKNIVLLLASLFFYAWGEPKLIIYMIVIILISYISGLLINKYENKKRTLVFVLSLIAILSFLIYFKYFTFILDNIKHIFGLNLTIKNIVMPIGISFYTFQILSYLIDLYRKKIKVQKNIILLSLYVTLFPQLVAGPIVRYETVENELRTRTENFDSLISGIKRFIKGLAKKVIISNNVALVADLIFENISNSGNIIGTSAAWLGAICYTLQIYYDFSGYSDMAIGLGKIFGFNFLENFNFPYIANSITDFWRRWHISLSTWFRDYIYIPLGGNRVGKKRWLLNILIVWMLTGLWHGAAWNFVIWGLYFAFLLIIEKIYLLKKLDKLPNVIRWLYSIILIIIGWVIFRSNTLGDITFMLNRMFIFKSTDYVQLFAINNISYELIYLIPAIILSFPIWNKINIKISDNYKYLITTCFYFALFIICIVMLVSSNFNPFIYFRF